MNATNDYDIQIRDYCKMNLYLVEKALKINIPLMILQQESGESLQPLFNMDKIGERPIMNAKVGKEENLDINYRVRRVIKMM